MEYLDEIKAYAKVNLVLNVLGKRDDGYHDIETIMQAIALHDEISLGWEETDGTELEVELDVGRPDLPEDETNLAWKAAQAMHDHFHPGKGERVEIEIIKLIPIAAGLGGGSSDAAAVIWGLAKLWGIEQSQELFDIGLEIGSDVPFFVGVMYGEPCSICRGRGEKLRPIRPFDYNVLLMTPNVKVSTKDVYEELKPEDLERKYSVGHFIEAKKTPERMTCLGNQLKGPCFRLYPEAKKLYGWFLGQKSLGYTLSGSGPTIFGLYPAVRTSKVNWDIHTPVMCEVHMVPTILKQWDVEEEEKKTPLYGMMSFKDYMG